MSTTIKVVIAGPRGKMGMEAVKMVTATPEFELVGVIDVADNGKFLHEVDPRFRDVNCPIYTDAKECLEQTNPDCLVDFTVADAGYKHIKIALECGVRPVVGTTGFTSHQLKEFEQLAGEKEIGCIIAPNFAIGAVLMMKFSQMAARYFPDVEIIELHHDEKRDAPSGTAVKTAQMIDEVRQRKKQGHPEERENIPGARGGDHSGMRIHSVRLPGLIAHQEVILGSKGETLTIRHDSYNRSSFMTGLKLAIKEVMNINGFVYGLENILF